MVDISHYLIAMVVYKSTAVARGHDKAQGVLQQSTGRQENKSRSGCQDDSQSHGLPGKPKREPCTFMKLKTSMRSRIFVEDHVCKLCLILEKRHGHVL